MTLHDVTVVIVPGLREHVAEHWQSLLVRRLPCSRTVEPLAHDKLSCAARVAALDATLTQVEGPVVLAAHSAGVMIVAHWARLHRRDGIVGALLATPADLEEPLPANYPTLAALREHGWLPVPREPLPFPAIVADWGASLSDLGDVGHLNPAAGYGEWPQALDLLAQLMQPLETTP